MNDLEERLRADLFGATDLIEAEPDLDAVMREGERVLRGRFVRRAAGGMAVALVVGLVAWVATVPREVPGVPAPVATPSASPVTSESASIDLQDGFTMNSRGVPYRSVDVSATRTQTGYRVSFAITDDQGAVRTVSNEVPVGRAWLTQYPRLMVGVVAARLDWRDSVYADMVGGISGTEKVLPGLGITVVVDVAEKPGNTIKGLLWQGADGLVRDDAGNDVPEAQVGLAGVVGTVYLSERLGVLGYRETGGGEVVSTQDLGPDSDPVKIAIWSGTTAPERKGRATVIGLLPDGASDPAVTLAGYGQEWSSGKLSGTGRVVFVAVGQDATGRKGSLVTKVVYTAADGKRIIYRPKG